MDENTNHQIDAAFARGDSAAAVHMVDVLLVQLAQQGRVPELVTFLEAMVARHPGDDALRDRLASLYHRLGRDQDAIDQLDVLGEMQLNQGQQSAAARTIQRIMAIQATRSAQ